MQKRDVAGARGMSGKDDDTAQRIWNIRNVIHALENVKDTMIEFLNSQETIDASTQRLWIADVKAAYWRTSRLTPFPAIAKDIYGMTALKE